MSKATKIQHITALAYNKRGKLLAVGKNSYKKSHPLQAHYGALSGRPSAIYLHAEIAALIKAKSDVYRIVILRYNRDGTPALARPCPACQLALRDYGVKHIEYTT